MNGKLKSFNPTQVHIINESVTIAEDLVSNFYKMSASQWLHLKYDVETLVNLCSREIVHGPFAQVVRYEGKRKGRSLTSSTYDLYKICLQDHSILSKLKQSPDIKLFPFSLYIVTHELIHIVRFCKFLQNFDASPHEKMVEETRVHENTYEVLNNIRVSGMEDVFKFYKQWRMP
ncbi:hypothetical protein QUF72_13820 [Desulfobacterales bacterium HSG2]|nr:hypothetical protein [Desulfobacterales bacterium HSG2]